MSALLLLLPAICCHLTLATANTAKPGVHKAKSSILPSSNTFILPLSENSQHAILDLRGGAVPSDDEYDDYSDEEGGGGTEVETTVVDTVMDVLLDTSKKFVMLVGRVTLETAYALQRAVEAGLSADEDEEDGEVSIVVKISDIVKRMWHAALHVPSDDEDEDMEETISSSPKKKRSKNKTSASKKEKGTDLGSDDNMGEDLSSYLIKAYNVKVDKDDEDDSKKESIKGGALSDALKYARSQARLLVVYIPSSPPPKKKSSGKTSYDQIAIQSMISKDVSSVARKKSIKRKKNEGGAAKYGSFVLWSTKAGGSEATASIKRLKVVQRKKGQKENSPILVVVYPAQVIDSSGRPKVIPRVLSQHHCNPPPTSESMASWLNALRKRHAKQYTAMQHELQEMQYFQERKEGYKESMVGDTKRKEEEKIKERERLAKEKAERERIEQIEKRREVLREELPEEPSADVEGVMTIALRFADGRTGRRRFDCDTELNELFNWVDGYYEMERERVVLSTMNGQRSFTFVDEAEGGEEVMTLKEAGLGRMTGLRVSEQKEDDNDESDEEGEEEEE